MTLLFYSRFHVTFRSMVPKLINNSLTKNKRNYFFNEYFETGESTSTLENEIQKYVQIRDFGLYQHFQVRAKALRLGNTGKVISLVFELLLQKFVLDIPSYITKI